MTLSTSPATLGSQSVSLITGTNGAGAVAPAHVLVNSSGGEIGTTGAPLNVAVVSGGGSSTANSVTLLAGTASVGAVTQAGGPWTVSWTGQTLAATQSGAWNVGITGSVAVTGAFYQATQPISAIALPLPTGAAQDATVVSVSTAIGTTADAAATNTLIGKTKELVNTFKTPIAVTINGALPAGTNTIGAVSQSGTWTVSSTTSGVYNSTPPTLTSGQSTALQTDANGRLLVASTGGGGSGGATASELHLGEVGGNVARFQSQFGPTTSTQYSAGQIMSAPIEITNAGRVAGGTGMMMGASIVLNTANTQPIDFVFFNAQPSGTYTAGSTFTAVSTDVTKISKAFHLTDWTPLGAAISLGEAIPSGKFYGCADPTKTQSVWVLPIARGNITLAAATDATLTVRMSRN